MLSGEKDITAVTFDLWGTLITNNEEGIISTKSQEMYDFFQSINCLIPYQSIKLSIELLIYKIRHVQRKKGRNLSNTEQIEILLNVLDVKLNQNSHKETMLNILQNDNSRFEIIEGVEKLLAELKQRGVRMALICNTTLVPGKILSHNLQKRGLSNYFEVMIFSNEVKYAKPHKDIFLLAADRLKVPITSIVHIGDDYFSDWIGANNAGAKGILLSKLKKHFNDKIAENINDLSI
ncbi:HAD family hydrolase [Priestia koreensis]|uniref:HAD family hydrolase n=1 Tax=Priestia koreensis TaxID=284581 RepID=UPI00203CA4B4|nr:HAD family hydrolase [Priestia koreensis]MCM3005848.1 HAD family hydrolase [Priestia koreensis]